MNKKAAPNLGISVYPDVRPIEEIKEYIELASKYEFTRVFSSMFSVEGTKEEVLDYFRELIAHAHKYEMEVDLDVNPMLFERLGASIEDLSIFHEIDVDILRMDMSYGLEDDLKLINNPYGIKIEFNSSFDTVEDLVKEQIDIDNVLVCHNFYPQKYTGLSWETFLTINKEIKELTDIRIGAFISSNAEETHGVWGAIDGLPTVERLRGLSIDLQARILHATGNVDDIIIGNAYATEEELRNLQNVFTERTGDWDNPLIDLMVEYGIVDLETAKLKKISLDLAEGISEIEKEIIYDFYPHIAFADVSDWMWRSRMPRFVYSDPDYAIKPRSYAGKSFEYGDVVIVNDNYKHYAGEVQIVLRPIENDGQRNYVGSLKGEEKIMIELLEASDIVTFIE